MMFLVVVEILILIGSIYGQGIISELNSKEEDIVDERVIRRKDFLENRMVNDWMNLENTVNRVNRYTRQLIQTGQISLSTLDNSSADCEPLLLAVSDDLADMMRNCRATGAFLVLNMEDLEEEERAGIYLDKPGIYLRDPDPSSAPFSADQDLLVERSPVSVIRKLGIPADSSWRVNIEAREDTGYYDFLYRPFQAALRNGKEHSWSDMGYWSAPYQIEGEEKWLISYSVPLILENGTVYGVLGVDITYDYMERLLPSDEINGSGPGAYLLAQETNEAGKYVCVFGGDGCFTDIGEDFISLADTYYHAEPLGIYNGNTLFANEQWVLVGTVPYSELRSFSARLNRTVVYAVYAALLLGIVVCFLSSYVLQRPLAKLSRQIKGQDPRKPVVLEPTGIREIDQMSEAIEKLSSDVIESSSQMTKIIEMASVRLAGFQSDHNTGKLFLTEHFFSMFLLDNIDEKNLDVKKFDLMMNSLGRYIVERDDDTGHYLFRIPDGAAWRYVRLSTRNDRGNYYGLAEDVTQSILEKEVLKHERDHDPLTNLYNRRAFRSRMQEILEEERILQGAFLMLDLDNLKYINDTYGHDYGDKYILEASRVFGGYLPDKAVYGRISGDEFNVFIYGCQSRRELQEHICHLKEGISMLRMKLPTGEMHRIRMSGGVAWYPEDSERYEDLLKYADFAMYYAKRKHKGEIEEFDNEMYRNQNMLIRNKALLGKLIEKEAVQYAFQPIVDAHTGTVFAYEALMRPALSGFNRISDILDAAQEEGKLNHVERMTWFVGMGSFVEHIQSGRVEKDCCLFINSIPNQKMEAELEEEFCRKYHDYMPLVVMELTEEEKIEHRAWEEKQSILRRFGGRVALDDYGTGYNSEKMLLSISPDFIKVDIAIVKDIHRSADKRAIVSYIVNYAHERDKYIIAEGVETQEELHTVIELGADYIQGFFLARPQLLPEGIPEDKKRIILNYNREK